MKDIYKWKDKREKRAILAFEDGTLFRGYSIGASVDREGEVVFNTGMTGYQEILSDPSYAGQFVTMTYTQIGNTGINQEDMESRKFFANGFIIHELNEVSNWRAKETLTESLIRYDIPGIAGVDTRTITSKIRNSGTMKAYMCCSGKISPEKAIANAKAWKGLDNQDYASKVSCEKAYHWDTEGRITKSWGICSSLPKIEFKVVAYDFGIKWNILRSLRLNGIDVTVVPAKTSASDVLKKKPDGVFLSNGPADPAAVSYAIESSKKLLGKVPIMGICLGHQILGMACGGERIRLKFGHHGCNHPVKRLENESVEITSQNHNFAIKEDSLPSDVEVTHVNLNDLTIEGLRHRKEPMFAVQYHPEASPGPHDPRYLFNQFKELMRR